MEKYNYYNREERAICAHLFRLLHENLDDVESPFMDFIEVLFDSGLNFKNGNSNLNDLKGINKSIYCEAAILRDKYYNDKPQVDSFMDALSRIVIRQKKVSYCSIYSELPEILRSPEETHPGQIIRKADAKNIKLNKQERIVYGEIQSMFNAKPDIVLAIDNLLLVGEAKFTERFKTEQLRRTKNIAEIWSKLLYKDLGFDEPPIYTVFTLGAEKYNPNISWRHVLEIANEVYPKNDRTRIAIESGAELLNRPKSIKGKQKLTKTNRMKVSYSSTRLLFKRDEIELLDWNEKFSVYASNDECTYEMTKKEFYDVFSNVAKTKSYKQAGIYHYVKTPAKAFQFIVS